MAAKKQIRKKKNKQNAPYKPQNDHRVLKSFLIFFIVFSLLVLGGFWAMKKFHLQNLVKVNETDTQIKQPKQEVPTVSVYFLKTQEGENTSFIEVKRELLPEHKKFTAAVVELLKGPTPEEKQKGIYSEIPSETKLLNIKEDKTAYTINLSDDFEQGGGADTMDARLKQLVKTTAKAAKGKDVYLELNGERAEVLGGEGIMVEQPISKNL